MDFALLYVYIYCVTEMQLMTDKEITRETVIKKAIQFEINIFHYVRAELRRVLRTADSTTLQSPYNVPLITTR